GGASVAEEIDRHTDPPPDVVPVLHSGDTSCSSVVLAVGTLPKLEPTVETARHDLAFLCLADELVVTQTQVPRQTAHRPAILQEDARIGLDAVAAVGRQAQCDLDRPAGVIRDRLHVAGRLRSRWHRCGRNATR